ncbi:glutathione peroxidase [Lacticaseibacillus rhamnosus]|uniref:glutathione peroxidase n=1 Tax=Lacticaseibacillus rhamnosus TaxID=47715 RepID=UPI0007DE7205|nr:glutathione peroxidase [Lacticaseibacillus rhamnosus]MBB1163720.1 glutathione peroxidase [Lacticaseibacillus rhamnosus]MCZ2733128.1 glutathione peroxidase [Lacticaseibacillus rhamnosus]MCZ2735721.1 glutathione peroxidase [Lacticaseibacillus rhamnosus]MCZ2742068.1 glutathione peroxidase [Lacticaseibacillus rhamnosus]MCZ2744889.1 glutathione peroxidase [Lacticaseibacillus rhamnosus]
MSIYDFEVTLEDGSKYSLNKYKGRPMLIVNTATKCGFAPQFDGLEALYKKYQKAGLIVLGFPSNQFKQELADGHAAAEACRMKYGVSFPMHQLIKVNGQQRAPLFKYLKTEAPGELGKSIKWNFTKFLVDRNGHVVKRFAPKTTPEAIEPAVEELLS